MELNWQTEAQRVFAVDEAGTLLSEGTWVVDDHGYCAVDYTFVSDALRGQGVASKLMNAIAEHFRANGLKTYATCSYADIWYERNADAYQDIIVPRPENLGIACKIKPQAE